MWLPLLSMANAAPTVSWEGEHAYHMQALLETPHFHRLFDRDSINDVRVTKIALSFDANCDGSPLNKRKLQVKCQLSGVDVSLTAFQNDASQAPQIEQAYARDYEGSTVQLQVANDGRILALDLEGVSKTREEQAVSQEQMRQLLLRAFSVLDVQLEEGKTEWKQKGAPMVFGLLTRGGTAGGMDYQHTIEPGADDTVVSKGRASVSKTEMQAGGNRSPLQIVSMKTSGQGRVDTETNRWAFRQVVVTGVLTSSSIESQIPQYFGMTVWAASPLGDDKFQSLVKGEPIDLSPEPEEAEEPEEPRGADAEEAGASGPERADRAGDSGRRGVSPKLL